MRKLSASLEIHPSVVRVTQDVPGYSGCFFPCAYSLETTVFHKRISYHISKAGVITTSPNKTKT